MSDFECDVVVVGAGVVGLAAARALAARGRDVVVLDAADAIGTGISSRNSEVIHAGLYYQPGSLKALACVEGRDRLYAYCAARGIPHRRCGKLIVLAPDGDAGALERLAATARANGVDDLRAVTAREIATLEPALRTGGGLLSPSTGIVDTHALLQAFQADLEAAGGQVVLHAPVVGGDVTQGLRIRTGGAEGAVLTARALVTCAGLAGPGLLARLAGFPDAHRPRASFAKGNYFALSGKAPFRRLVYPLPEAAGLGIHATLDLGGRVRFGPDVEWVEDESDFAVDPRRADRFYAAIRTYWPGLPDGALRADYAGIRPKLAGEGHPAQDFLLQDACVHGVPGLVNVLGIESPGLTASLALAERIADLVGRD